MDFVSIASALYQARRFLHEGDDEDDILGSYDADPAPTQHAASSSTTSLSGGSVAPPSDPFPSSSSSSSEPRQPLLSPTAEAELLLLATNFLLYVAMVIITTLVTRLYFPESLRRGESSSSSSSSSLSSSLRARRSTSYVRIAEDSASFYDDDDDENENENENDGEDEDERVRNRRDVGSSSDSFLEFDQSTSPKLQVVKRLAFCCLMLNVTFVAWGLLQERMLTRRYPRWTGEYFTYSYALVFSNRFWTLIMSGLLFAYLKPHRSETTVIYEYAFPSISNMLSSWCQYEALRYVTFPAATIFKSFKLVPVMVMGKLLGNKEYEPYDYVVALVTGAGIALFMSSTDELQFGYDIHQNEVSGKWTGVMLLGLFLFFDSFTGQWQSRMFHRHRDLSMVELLFATSAFSTFLSFITLVHQHELRPAVDFVVKHSEIQVHFFLFSVCSTIGQLFIFYTIKNFGAVVFTIIMTTRVLLSIGLSCVLYGHTVDPTGFLGLTMVVGAVGYRIRRQAAGTRLVKWQGIDMDDDDRAAELVQEWHEHLDT